MVNKYSINCGRLWTFYVCWFNSNKNTNTPAHKSTHIVNTRARSSAKCTQCMCVCVRVRMRTSVWEWVWWSHVPLSLYTTQKLAWWLTTSSCRCILCESVCAHSRIAVVWSALSNTSLLHTSSGSAPTYVKKHTDFTGSWQSHNYCTRGMLLDLSSQWTKEPKPAAVTFRFTRAFAGAPWPWAASRSHQHTHKHTLTHTRVSDHANLMWASVWFEVYARKCTQCCWKTGRIAVGLSKHSSRECTRQTKNTN